MAVASHGPTPFQGQRRLRKAVAGPHDVSSFHADFHRMDDIITKSDSLLPVIVRDPVAADVQHFVNRFVMLDRSHREFVMSSLILKWPLLAGCVATAAIKQDAHACFLADATSYYMLHTTC